MAQSGADAAAAAHILAAAATAGTDRILAAAATALQSRVDTFLALHHLVDTRVVSACELWVIVEEAAVATAHLADLDAPPPAIALPDAPPPAVALADAPPPALALADAVAAAAADASSLLRPKRRARPDRSRSR